MIIFYTWEEFEKDIQRMITKIKKQKVQPTAIYGIPNGGLPLAVTLSNHLKIPMYLNFEEVVQQVRIPKELLIIDDISDSGVTLLKLFCINLFTTATLFIRETTKFKPNISIITISKDPWVCFPWEDKNVVDKKRTRT